MYKVSGGNGIHCCQSNDMSSWLRVHPPPPNSSWLLSMSRGTNQVLFLSRKLKYIGVPCFPTERQYQKEIGPAVLPDKPCELQGGVCVSEPCCPERNYVPSLCSDDTQVCCLQKDDCQWQRSSTGDVKHKGSYCFKHPSQKPFGGFKTDITHDRGLYRDIVKYNIPKHSVLRCVLCLYAVEVVSICLVLIIPVKPGVHSQIGRLRNRPITNGYIVVESAEWWVGRLNRGRLKSGSSRLWPTESGIPIPIGRSNLWMHVHPALVYRLGWVGINTWRSWRVWPTRVPQEIPHFSWKPLLTIWLVVNFNEESHHGNSNKLFKNTYFLLFWTTGTNDCCKW